MLIVERVASRHGRKPLPQRTFKILIGLLGFGLLAASLTLLIVTRHSNTRHSLVVPQIAKDALKKMPQAETGDAQTAQNTQNTQNTQISQNAQNPNANANEAKAQESADEYNADGFPKAFQRIQLSNWPSLRAYHLVNLITQREAEHIMQLALPELLRSRVVGDDKGVKNVISEVRTSQGMFLMSPEHLKDPVVVAFRQRLSKAIGLPVKNMEATQVLRYEGGGYYRPHPDYFAIDYNELLKRGGQRMVTVLCYLNTPERGGETRFPRVNITVPAVAGNCVEFYSLNENHQPDPNSWHEALPAGAGVTKWSMPTWVREFEFH